MNREQQTSQQFLQLNHHLRERITRENRPIEEKPSATSEGSNSIIDQQRSEEPISLDHQHKMEWEILAAVESESWRVLDKQHRQSIMQLRSAEASWSRQVAALQEQLVEIQCLYRTNQQKRVLLKQRQAMDKKDQFIWSH